MLANLFYDFNRQLERATPFCACHHDGRARDGCEKSFYFQSQRLVAPDIKQTAIKRETAFAVGLDGDRSCLLRRVVNRNIFVRLKESELSRSLGRDSTCCEICYTTILKFDARVGDINTRREDRHTCGPHFERVAFNKRQDHIKIVDH